VTHVKADVEKAAFYIGYDAVERPPTAAAFRQFPALQAGCRPTFMKIK